MKKKVKYFIIGLMGLIIINIFIFKYIDIDIKDNLTFKMDVMSDYSQDYQVFYSLDGKFTEENSVFKNYNDPNLNLELEFIIPSNIKYIRVDLGNKQGKTLINHMIIEYKGNDYAVDNKELMDVLKVNMIDRIRVENGALVITSKGEDPYLIINMEKLGITHFVEHVQHTGVIVHKYILCLLIDIFLMLFILHVDKLLALVFELFRNKKLIINLARNDFKTKYAGSYLGIIWAFIQPIVTILVYWFVFQVGLRAGSVNNFPFVLWFASGLIPWFFFSDAVVGGANSFIEYSYLVKKVVFRISVLPVVKVISALFIHVFFVMFLIFMFAVNNYLPDIYYLQLVYYSFCMFILIVGISYITSSIVVFFKDLGQIINIILQVGMWMTPIMWNYSMLPEKYRFILVINPMYYVVEGYRDALLNKVWFWDKPNLFFGFWFITIGVLSIGVLIFKRLKIHFADVL